MQIVANYDCILDGGVGQDDNLVFIKLLEVCCQTAKVLVQALRECFYAIKITSQTHEPKLACMRSVQQRGEQ